MQIYKNILVPLDCSSVDDKVIEHIIPLALQNDSSVMLLHVVHSHTLDEDAILYQKAKDTLSRYEKILQNNNIKVSTKMLQGEPEDEILNEIEDSDYDLIAMATHGHSFFKDILYGSVTQILKHKISIPLLLIKGRD
ncbi:MAG: universal stress protein [Syntrophothermus sp.]